MHFQIHANPWCKPIERGMALSLSKFSHAELKVKIGAYVRILIQ